MARLPLTKNGDVSESLINRLPLPKAKPIIYWHPVFRGFGVIISAKKGTRSYICQRDVHGKSRRVTLGVVGAITPDEVLAQANGLLQTMRAGEDPCDKTTKATAVGRIMDRMLQAKQGTRREGTLKGYRWQIEKYSGDWLKIPLGEIASDDVMKRHRKLTMDAGPVSADNWAGTFRTLWNFAEDMEIVSGRNPVDILKRQRLLNGKPVRDRIVPLDKVPDFLLKVDETENIVQREYIRFLLFTALRRNEAANLRWADIRDDCVHVSAERNKSKRDFAIPLSSSALAAIEPLPRGDWVFPADSASGHIEDPRKALKRTGYGVSCHDLRRTWGSAAAFVIPDAIRKRLLNHAPTNVTERSYTVLNDAERLREFSEKVDRHLCGE